MRIYLIGFMGSGKSTLGKIVSTQLQVQFLDTDEEIEKLAQRSIEEIFIDRGEFYFRDLEHDVLLSTTRLEQAIVATGGGLPCYRDHMDWILQNGIAVYLEWPLEKLMVNLENADVSRPLLSGLEMEERRKRIEDLFIERKSCYERCAITIEMTGDQSKDVSTLIRTCQYIW